MSNSNLEVKHLTDLAEKGRGTEIKEALASVPFDEKYRIMKEIVQQNAKDTQSDATLPHLWIDDSSFATRLDVSLRVDKGLPLGLGVLADPTIYRVVSTDLDSTRENRTNFSVGNKIEK